jgi:hypothetical protein
MVTKQSLLKQDANINNQRTEPSGSVDTAHGAFGDQKLSAEEQEIIKLYNS